MPLVTLWVSSAALAQFEARAAAIGCAPEALMARVLDSATLAGRSVDAGASSADIVIDTREGA